MDVAAAIVLIRLITDAIHQQVPAFTKPAIQALCFVIATLVTLLYHLQPLPLANIGIPYAGQVLNILVVWLLSMGANDLLTALQKQGVGK